MLRQDHRTAPKIGRTIRLSVWVLPFSCVLTALWPLSGGAQNSPPALTGITIFDTNKSALCSGDWTGFFGGSFNNTHGGDQADNLYVINGGDLNGPFINHGNGSGVDINIPLTSGTHTFTFYAGGGDDVGCFGMNLFFNGNGTSPGISVSAPLNSPAFSPDNGSTMSLFQAAVPGAGTASFTVGSTKVTLSAYILYSFHTLNIDRVGAYNDAPDGQPDHIGQFTIEVGCQVSEARVGQCDGKPGHWGGETYALSGKTMCALGCATTSLSRALDFQGIKTLSLMQGVFTNDPGYLNDFMIQVGVGSDYSAGPPPDDNNVKPDETTRDVGLAAGRPNLHFNNSALPVALGGAGSGEVDPGDHTFSQAAEDLESIVCGKGAPVMVGVTSRISRKFNRHYVLVTGKESVNGGSCSAYVDAAAHCIDFLIDDPFGVPYTTLSQYGKFVIWGFVEDPPTDNSGLDLAVGENVNLLVTDTVGRRTGVDSTGAVLNEIPRSGYFATALDDDDVGGPGTGTTNLVDVFQPSEGTYTMTLSGLGLGTYSLSVRAFSQDGSAQPAVVVQGVSGTGSGALFQVQFSSTAGSALTITVVATFQSTLADISNGLQLGLIDNQGIANSLSAKINAASDAEAAGNFTTAMNILNAFKNEVSAQTSKHITGIAPQVLTEDANSLLAQLNGAS